jgi:hypothetical protein
MPQALYDEKSAAYFTTLQQLFITLQRIITQKDETI